MTKIAILNSKPLIPASKEVLNLLIENQTLTGKGYLPDDEDSLQLNVPKSFILTDITDINLTYNEKTTKEAHERGTTTLRDLAHPTITSDVILSGHLTEFLDVATSSKKTPVTSVTGSELLFLIQECHKSKCPLHVIMKAPETDYPIIQCHLHSDNKITCGLTSDVLHSVHRDELLAAINHGTIHTLSSHDSPENLINFCYQLEELKIPFSKTYPLISKHARDILGLKTNGLTVNTAPNISIVDLNTTQESSLVTISEGLIVHNSLNTDTPTHK